MGKIRTRAFQFYSDYSVRQIGFLLVLWSILGLVEKGPHMSLVKLIEIQINLQFENDLVFS